MPDLKPRVLIIDDEPDSVSLLMDYLAERYGLMVSLDGEDGLRKAKLGKPDVILLDMAMPKLDGLETCRLLKGSPLTQSVPVIFLSAHAGVQDRLDGFEAGAVDFIAKPFTEQEVLARVAVHVSTHLRLRQLESLAVTQRSGQPTPALDDRSDSLFLQACNYLREHLVRTPELPELSRALQTTDRVLNALFKDRLGMTVFEFSLELRMDAARSLLDGGTQQVQRIAALVGYQNAGDLTRAFRRHYGLTPSQYRQQSESASDEPQE